ncbi:hypothetical protein C5167_021534 [Papaver somniferum]|nr:hypothetical protein C5167_021534 [Papaver somniferum]
MEVEGLVMGVVRDGTTSGILPNNEEFVVHYPGYPSSASQAVQTLERAERIMKDTLHEYLRVILAVDFAFSDLTNALFDCHLSSLKLRDEKPEAASSKIIGGDKSRFPK